MSAPPSNNHKWLKRRIRERMRQTGQKYTAAMRDIQTEMAAEEAAEQEAADAARN